MTVQRDRWGKKRAAVCGANGKKIRDLPAFQIRNGVALSFFARLYSFSMAGGNAIFHLK